jgi:hypothetical protein
MLIFFVNLRKKQLNHIKKKQHQRLIKCELFGYSYKYLFLLLIFGNNINLKNRYD